MFFMVTQHSIHKYKNTRDDEKEKPPQKKRTRKGFIKTNFGSLNYFLTFHSPLAIKVSKKSL